MKLRHCAKPPENAWCLFEAWLLLILAWLFSETTHGVAVHSTFTSVEQNKLATRNSCSHSVAKQLWQFCCSKVHGSCDEVYVDD